MDDLKVLLTQLLLKGVGMDLLEKARKKQKGVTATTAKKRKGKGTPVTPEEKTMVGYIEEALEEVHVRIPRIKESIEEMLLEMKRSLAFLDSVYNIANARGGDNIKLVNKIIGKSGLSLSDLKKRVEYIETYLNNFTRMLERIQMDAQDIEEFTKKQEESTEKQEESTEK